MRNETTMEYQSKLTQVQKYLDAIDGRKYFNGSILIGHQGQVVAHRCYGKANFEHDIDTLPSTKYRIGSLTKAFTAAAILQLQEKGTLNVNDPIGKYIHVIPYGDQITIHHILTHTSGLPDHTSTPDYWSTKMRLPFTIEMLLSWFNEQPLLFSPGEAEAYSNSAYFLLGHVIEKVSGLSYSDYLHKHIFKPLGMDDSGVDNGSSLIHNRATGYHVWEDVIHIDPIDMSHAFSAYGIYSTIQDLYIWDQGLYSTKILNEQSLELMFTPNEYTNGCGWFVTDATYNDRTSKLIYHFGNINGYNSAIYRFPGEELTIITLSNLGIDAIERVTADLAKLLHGVDVVIPNPTTERIDLDPNIYRMLSGVYIGSEQNDSEFHIEYKGSKCYITMPRRYGAPYKYEMLPISYDGQMITCTPRFVNEYFCFILADQQNVAQMTYIDVNGKSITMVKQLNE